MTKRIDPSEGLEKTLARLDHVLKKQTSTAVQAQTSPLQISQISIEVKRTIPASENEVYHPPVRIETSKGEVLGVLPRAFAGESQLLRITLSERPRKLIVTAGNNPFVLREDIRLGEFQFESSALPGKWSVFADSAGQALGTVSHVYRYNE